jgi:hypothetical protein
MRAHTCRVARGMLTSFTRRANRAVMTAEAVDGRRRGAAPARRRRRAAGQVPWLRGSVAETGWTTLFASVHETKRARDTGTPVALASEQRTSVMLESERTTLPPSKTRVRRDWGRGEEPVSVLGAPRPTPRPIASAATTVMTATMATERLPETTPAAPDVAGIVVMAWGEEEGKGILAEAGPFCAGFDETPRSISCGAAPPPPSLGSLDTIV